MPTITSGTERFLRDASIKGVALGYEPFPKQREFHASPAKYRLFGGAAGPGKSKALLMEVILQAHEHPGANTLLLRRTFPELEQSLLLYFRRDVPRELYKSFNESKHVVTWKNGSTTRFGYCQSESDVYQYQGAEFLFIGIDELTLFTLRQWQFLTSRNRCPIPNSFPCMAGATNPGNIGHAWVKSLWIDRQPAPGMENPSEYDPADYDFIPARVSDNPVYAGDENYLKTLRALPSHLRRAFLDGDWEVFAGQYFDNFDCSRHVIRAENIWGPQVDAEQGSRGPGEGRSGDQSSLGDQWKPWWPRWISIDWGFEHPAAVYWHCAIPSDLRNAGVSPANLRADEETENRRRPGGATNPGPVEAGVGGAGTPACAVSVEARGFSPAKNDGAESPSSLPKAVAQAESPERQNRVVGARYIVPGDDSCLDAAHSATHSDDTIIPSGVPVREARNRDAVEESAVGVSGQNQQQIPRRPENGLARDDNAGRIVTYREYVTRRTTPRDLAHEIVRRSLQFGCHSEARRFVDGAEESAFRSRAVGESRSLTPILDEQRRGWVRDDSAKQGSGEREKIDAIYLSPDAFAHRTGEASIAEQMGDVFVAAGLPRPVPADDDRVGGWMLMYQMLEATKRGPQVDAEQGSRGPGEGRSGDRSSLGDQAWLITDNCFELIRTLPTLVRDPVRVEDIEKCDGDDPADAARYGLKSRYAAHRGDPSGWRSRMPLADRVSAHAYSADPTIRAMQSRKFFLEESGAIRSDKFLHSARPVPFAHRRRH